MPDEVAQPSEGQDPTQTSTAPVQPDPGQGVSGPWADQLESRFSDPTIRQQVDGFLRETVQPYVTRIEQARTPEEAAQLYEALNEDPGSTYLALTEELWGEDVARAVFDTLQGNLGDGSQEPAAQEPAAAPQQPADAGQLAEQLKALGIDPAVVKEVVDSNVNAQRQAAYDAELARVKQGNPDVNIVDDVFHPFVMAAEGNFDAAVEGYKSWLAQAQQAGVVPAAQPTEQPAPDVPPAAIGSDSQQQTTPPVQKQYASIDSALDDFFNEIKSAAPPSVGAT